MAFRNTFRLLRHRNILTPLIKRSSHTLMPVSSCSVWKSLNSWSSALCLHSRTIHEQSATAVQQKAEENKSDPSSTENIDEATLEIQNLAPETARKLKIIQMEHAVWLSLGKRVPENMTDQLWLHMLYKFDTRAQRMKYYGYLHKTEKSKLAEKEKKEQNRIKKDQKRAEKDELMQKGEYVEEYTIFLYVRNKTMNKWYYNNLFYAYMNGPSMVIDMGFTTSMRNQQLMSLANQLLYTINANKLAREPFHVHLCNVDEEVVGKGLTKWVAGIENMPVTVSQENYLKHYPKDKLVYLSPDSPNVLHEFRHDDVYIIGGLVDSGHSQPLTYAKAKKEGIRSAKLPLDYYLRWKMGTKSLTLNQMMKILLTASETRGDWDKAFKHVPSRKLEIEHSSRK